VRGAAPAPDGVAQTVANESALTPKPDTAMPTEAACARGPAPAAAAAPPGVRNHKKPDVGARLHVHRRQAGRQCVDAALQQRRGRAQHGGHAQRAQRDRGAGRAGRGGERGLQRQRRRGQRQRRHDLRRPAQPPLPGQQHQQRRRVAARRAGRRKQGRPPRRRARGRRAAGART